MKSTLAKMIEAGYVVVKTLDANPYREGTHRHERYTAYKNGRSVAAVLNDPRVRRDGFRHDVNTGIIKLVKKH